MHHGVRRGQVAQDDHHAALVRMRAQRDVTVRQADLADQRRALGQRSRQRRQSGQVAQPLAHRVIAADAEQRRAGRVERQHAPLGVESEHAVADRPEQGGVARAGRVELRARSRPRQRRADQRAVERELAHVERAEQRARLVAPDDQCLSRRRRRQGDDGDPTSRAARAMRA